MNIKRSIKAAQNQLGIEKLRKHQVKPINSILDGQDNKAFQPNMGGYSIFACCLNVTSDQGIRLDWYMAEEGNSGGWKVEDC